MFNLVVKFVGLQPVLVKLLNARQKNSHKLKVTRSKDLTKLSKKTKSAEEQISSLISEPTDLYDSF